MYNMLNKEKLLSEYKTHQRISIKLPSHTWMFFPEILSTVIWLLSGFLGVARKRKKVTKIK